MGAAAFAKECTLLVVRADDCDVAAAAARKDAAYIDAEADIGWNAGGAAHDFASVERVAMI